MIVCYEGFVTEYDDRTFSVVKSEEGSQPKTAKISQKMMWNQKALSSMKDCKRDDVCKEVAEKINPLLKNFCGYQLTSKDHDDTTTVVSSINPKKGKKLKLALARMRKVLA